MEVSVEFVGKQRDLFAAGGGQAKIARRQSNVAMYVNNNIIIRATFRH